MPDRKSTGQIAETVASLNRRAAELWGPERAEALRAVIDETARDISQLSQATLSSEEEPAFYL